MIAPVNRSRVACTFGRRTCRARSTARARRENQATSRATMTAAMASAYGSTGAPGRTNCGNRAAKKTASFGLEALVTSPERHPAARAGSVAGPVAGPAAGPAAGSVPGAVAWRAPIPDQLAELLDDHGPHGRTRLVRTGRSTHAASAGAGAIAGRSPPYRTEDVRPRRTASVLTSVLTITLSTRRRQWAAAQRLGDLVRALAAPLAKTQPHVVVVDVRRQQQARHEGLLDDGDRPAGPWRHFRTPYRRWVAAGV